MYTKHDLDRLSLHAQQYFADRSKNPPIPFAELNHRRSEWQKKAGVYVIWNTDLKPMYVGESNDLSKRMGDLYSTFNHTFRRKIGNFLFQSRSDFEPAHSKKRFNDQWEAELTAYMNSSFFISLYETYLGRRELEDALIKHYSPLHSKPKKR
jgi:hypothetical protein